MRRLVVLAVVAGVALAACGTSDATEVPADDAVEEADVGGEATFCVPGEPKGQCSDDGLGVVVCNAEGTAYEVKPCGADSLCLDGARGCTICKPGSRKCQDDDVVLRCDETGTEYVEAQDCHGSDTGQICLNGACVKLCDVNSKIQSYIGCEYWGADLDNAFVPGGESGFYDAQNAQYAIVVSNTSPKYAAHVQIFIWDADQAKEVEVTHDTQGNPIPTDAIPPLSLRVFNLPGKDMDKTRNIHSTSITPFAYRVVSSIPITAYQFNPLENVNVFSNDATVLLPSNALGKYYIVMTREETFQELRGFLTVVAVYPGETQVTVTVTAPTLADNGIDHMEPGDSKTFTLKQYDVLNIETDAFGADLTGSVVAANHPVAVFGGSQASNAPNTNHCCPDGECTSNQIWLTCKEPGANCLCEWPMHNLVPPQEVPCTTNDGCLKYNTCCADHLEMQMFPVKTWGKEYVATPSYPRGKEKDVWRIMAAQAGTTVTTYPQQATVPVLDLGEYVDFESSESFEIHAMRPLLVGQFLAAQDAPDPNIGGVKGKDDAETGDPTFILAVPVEQFRSEYVFLAPNKYAFDAVNLVVPTGVAVYLDGQELRQEDLTFKPAKTILQEMKEKQITDPTKLGPRFGDYSVVGSGKWAVWRVVVADGVHMAQSDQPFGVIAYGYDRYVSYGYPAGLNLEDLKLVSDPTM
jgi:hypothetical protein